MSYVVEVRPGGLAAALGTFALRHRKATVQGIHGAARRARTHLVQKSPVFDGHLKNAWKTLVKDNGAEVINEAPYAGVVESGARPHGVSAEGREAIRRWVAKKLLGIPAGAKSVEADRIAGAIVHKIATKGQQGKFFARDSLPLFQRWVGEEVDRAIARAVGR